MVLNYFIASNKELIRHAPNTTEHNRKCNVIEFDFGICEMEFIFSHLNGQRETKTFIQKITRTQNDIERKRDTKARLVKWLILLLNLQQF